MTSTLSEARGSIEHFICAATKCARKSLGFSCMLTVFPVALAVSEAMDPSLRGIKAWLKYFVSQMATNTTSWLVVPRGTPKPTDVTQMLTEIRNGLAHALSLPENVFLADNIEDARQTPKQYPNKYEYVISTVDFVEAVDKTVQRLIQDSPGVTLDPHQKSHTKRAPADVHEVEGSPTSGSAAAPQKPQRR